MPMIDWITNDRTRYYFIGELLDEAMRFLMNFSQHTLAREVLMAKVVAERLYEGYHKLVHEVAKLRKEVEELSIFRRRCEENHILISNLKRERAEIKLLLSTETGLVAQSIKRLQRMNDNTIFHQE